MQLLSNPQSFNSNISHVFRETPSVSPTSNITIAIAGSTASPKNQDEKSSDRKYAAAIPTSPVKHATFKKFIPHGDEKNNKIIYGLCCFDKPSCTLT